MKTLQEWANDGPVRLCCGQRHIGPICPDGKVACCLCFTRVKQENLNVRQDGVREDVCRKCAEEERMMRDSLDKI